jgi:GNAT superfamily N-acetyltransferase
MVAASTCEELLEIDERRIGRPNLVVVYIRSVGLTSTWVLRRSREPRHIRSGVGRALLAHAIAEARRRGAGRLTILADPSAAAFYERAGAVRIGEAPSDAVPGRLLPLYEVRLDSTGDRDLEPHLGGRSKR